MERSLLVSGAEPPGCRWIGLALRGLSSQTLLASILCLIRVLTNGMQGGSPPPPLLRPIARRGGLLSD